MPGKMCHVIRSPIKKHAIQTTPTHRGMIRWLLGELGMQLAVSSAHPALKTVKHQQQLVFSTQEDRKKRGGRESLRACQREWDELWLSSPLSIRNQHGDSKVIRHWVSPQPSSPRRTHATPLSSSSFLLFPIPHIWVIARPYCLLCFVVVLYILLFSWKILHFFYWSVDRPANHTGNLHRLRNVNNKKQLTVNNFSSALIKTQLKTKRVKRLSKKESHVISFSYHCHCQIVYRKSFLIASL